MIPYVTELSSHIHKRPYDLRTALQKTPRVAAGSLYTGLIRLRRSAGYGTYVILQYTLYSPRALIQPCNKPDNYFRALEFTNKHYR